MLEFVHLLHEKFNGQNLMSKPTKKRVTSTDIAEAAGVSQATVSRAFDPDSKLSQDTRAKVLAVAEQLGYRPNPVGRLFARDSGRVVAVIVRHLESSVRALMISKLLARLQEQGYLALLFQASTREDLATLVPKVLEYKPSVIIISGYTPELRVTTLCNRAEKPLIILNQGYQVGTLASYVTSDHAAGARAAAYRLIETGAQRIGLVSGNASTGANEARVKGFLQGLEECEATLWADDVGNHSYQGGYQAALRMMASAEPPDGVFCTNDRMAMGFLDAVRYEFQLKVPESVSIIGYDNLDEAAWPSYDLTTVNQDIDTVLRLTTQAVGEIIADPQKRVTECIEVSLVDRSTTRKKPRNSNE